MEIFKEFLIPVNPLILKFKAPPGAFALLRLLYTDSKEKKVAGVTKGTKNHEEHNVVNFVDLSGLCDLHLDLEF